MTTQTEALKLALDWFKCYANKSMSRNNAEALADEVVDAIEKALAQPEQEPVALPCCGYADASAIKWNPHNQVVQCHNCGQIYTTSPQSTWVGLTDEEIKKIAKKHRWHEQNVVPHLMPVYRSLEAKLKEKNT